MSTINKIYAKTFGLFLLLAAGGGALVSFINRYLRTHDMASQTSTYLLWLFLMVYFFFIGRWIFRRLKAADRDK